MATYDQTTNTWTLDAGEISFELTDTGDTVVGNDLGNEIAGNDSNNTLTGSAGDDTLIGGLGDDSLAGGDDNDTLDGGVGADTMVGGAGNDFYHVDDANDVVTEEVDGGTDTVSTAFDVSLAGTQIENVVLTAAAQATGNDLNNTLTGSTGNDTLIGGGGADSLVGGDGDDVYYVDRLDDIVRETAGEASGRDEVRTTVEGFSIASLASIENLTLLGQVITGTGNLSDNVITGNDNGNRLNGNGGNDHLIGGDGNDELVGGADNDTLDGGDGLDQMYGGTGDDTYIVNSAGDDIFEDADSGNDTIISALNIDLRNTHVENATLTAAGTIIGNDFNNILTGSDGNDGLEGGKGNDRLAGGMGIDLLSGGEGDDTYAVDDDDDSVTEQVGEGTDRVFAGVSWSLASDQSLNVEHLTLTGSGNINGSGSEIGNEIVGNNGGNTLRGEGGNDTLTGADGNDVLIGGAGVDNMGGGIGDDKYVIDADDLISESENEGRDTVEVAFDYTLLANFENLTLLAGAANGTGNTLNNEIVGNAAANTLFGLEGNDRLDGGAGADRMEGGAGDDTYIVENAGDVIVEAGAGVDTVNAHFSYALAADLENLILHGNGAMTGTGNASSNQMFGNNGATTLDGGAGNDLLEGGEGNDLLQGGDGNDRLQDYLGDDTMVGGAGDDDFAGGRGNDTMDGGAGSDTVNLTGSRSNYIIGANADGSLTITDTRGAEGDGTDVVRGMQVLSFKASGEIMTLQPDDLPPLPLPPPLVLKGNKKANKLTAAETDDLLFGLGGNDTLKGLGGADRLYGGTGKDKLYGGAGADVFVFNTKPHKKKDLDKVYDFNVKDDTIWLDNKISKKLGKKGNETKPAKMSKKFFKVGDEAKDKNDYVFYNKKTGGLFYDADGSGAGAAAQIAKLSKKLKLKADDFFIV